MIKSNEEYPQTIATLHGDCHDARDIEVMMKYSDLWIRVKSLTLENVEVLKSHPKGKVEKWTLDFSIENQRFVRCSSSVKQVQAVQSIPVEDPSSIEPISSFNLSLTDKEKEDRSKVEMPFWKKESKIDYVPDENDDWDDEDPDDDLDI